MHEFEREGKSNSTNFDFATIHVAALSPFMCNKHPLPHTHTKTHIFVSMQYTYCWEMWFTYQRDGVRFVNSPGPVTVGLARSLDARLNDQMKNILLTVSGRSHFRCDHCYRSSCNSSRIDCATATVDACWSGKGRKVLMKLLCLEMQKSNICNPNYNLSQWSLCD